MTHSRPKPDLSSDPTLDRLLAEHFNDGALPPSSGFAATVMEAARTEAAMPQPIPFPWRRVLPGAVAALAGLLAFAAWVLHQWTEALRTDSSRLLAVPPSSGAASAGLAPMSTAELTLIWVTLAVLLSVVAVFASLRLASR
ncbi:MAG TPA: hypothetical protein VG714_02620 [Acidobacteriaceae bacterium]|nr:hypothetical protein [Acidobacteriaceae bacterium]